MTGLCLGPDHARILAHVVLANLEALARIRSDRNGWWIGAEAFGVPVAVEPRAEDDVRALRDWSWLVWDLHFGGAHPGVARYLDPVESSVLDRIGTLAVADHVIAGLDFYPTSVTPVGGPAPDWSVDGNGAAFALEEFRVARALPGAVRAGGNLEPLSRRRRPDSAAARPHRRTPPLARRRPPGARALLVQPGVTSTTGRPTWWIPGVPSPRSACSMPTAGPGPVAALFARLASQDRQEGPDRPPAVQSVDSWPPSGLGLTARCSRP